MRRDHGDRFHSSRKTISVPTIATPAICSWSRMQKLWPISFSARPSPAVLPWGVSNRKRAHLLAALRFDHAEYHHGVIALRVQYPFDAALDICGQAGEYRRGGAAFLERLAVNGPALGPGRMEEPARDFLLFVSDNMQNGRAAYRQALEHVALPSHGGHDQGWFEGHLRNPGDRRSAIAVITARGQHIHSVRQHAQRLQSDFCVHAITPAGSPGRHRTRR